MMKNHPVLESKKTPLYPKQAEHLRFQRKKLEKKQNEICEIIGRDLTTYRKWEKGYDRPDCEVLVQLSELYGVSTDYLLGKIEEKNHDLHYICDYIGLSESSIYFLHDLATEQQLTRGWKEKNIIKVIDLLLDESQADENLEYWSRIQAFMFADGGDFTLRLTAGSYHLNRDDVLSTLLTLNSAYLLKVKNRVSSAKDK